MFISSFCRYVSPGGFFQRKQFVKLSVPTPKPLLMAVKYFFQNRHHYRGAFFIFTQSHIRITRHRFPVRNQCCRLFRLKRMNCFARMS